MTDVEKELAEIEARAAAVEGHGPWSEVVRLFIIAGGDCAEICQEYIDFLQFPSGLFPSLLSFTLPYTNSS